MAPTRQRGTLTVVATLLFVAGWATNHFAAMIPVLREREGMSATVLAGAFGVYALGLLPGLLGGGGLSDRVGRRSVVLTGCMIAALGNLLMLCWHQEAGIYLGRLVVGAGVGLAMSAGTAWAGDLAGRRGTTVAGTTLTAGFACGPLVSGLLAQFLPGAAALLVPFGLTIAVSLASVLVGLRATAALPLDAEHHVAPGLSEPVGAEPLGAGMVPANDRTVARALARSVPMAVWVFASVTVPVLVLAGRVGGEHNGPWLPGVACALALGTGVAIQVLARRAEWGPRAGVVGAGLAAVGFVLSAVVDAHQGVALFVVASVILGSAYGLCLRAGLVDVENLTPPEHRGITIGVYYVCTYLGFGLPVLLEGMRSPVGVTAPLLALAGLAATAAGLRVLQLRNEPGVPSR